ncbi:MAG: inositol monophosphatase family protein [Leptospiraceae bacterium]|nr:inositol monophosphatase family protein [Leptospiraceae bacterium]MDW8307364.1 inositol monophosphatase family protein [Leptospiraceae bacterium]
MDYLRQYGRFLQEISRGAGEVILKYYQKKIRVELKEDNSPVTIADKKAEEYLRRQIKKKFPHHGFWGEESGQDKTEEEYVWVVDPIDGTKSFVVGLPLFTTLVALLHHKRPVLGLIYQPLLQELVIGDGKKTFYNGKKCQVRPCRFLNEAVLLTTDIELIRQHQNLENFLLLMQKVSFVRTWGDGYGYLLLATGRADIMLDPIMHPWDIMALVPVIQGAGGVISDFSGNDPVSANSIVAAPHSLHSQVLDILQGNRK